MRTISLFGLVCFVLLRMTWHDIYMYNNYRNNNEHRSCFYIPTHVSSLVHGTSGIGSQGPFWRRLTEPDQARSDRIPSAMKPCVCVNGSFVTEMLSSVMKVGSESVAIREGVERSAIVGIRQGLDRCVFRAVPCPALPCLVE
ncbi:hypothetical protein F4802DRAFT_587428 [Xylaria palmicola]|nr:hypothetical protein F4802DRAFT_587428 [Xylaria palmicola]